MVAGSWLDTGKNIGQKHGGEVTAHRAASGTGSIFRVRLPLIPVAVLEQFYQQQAQTAEPHLPTRETATYCGSGRSRG